MKTLPSVERAAELATRLGHRVDQLEHRATADLKAGGVAISPCPGCNDGYDAVLHDLLGGGVAAACKGCNDPEGIARALLAAPAKPGDDRLRLVSLAEVRRIQLAMLHPKLRMPLGTLTVVCGTQGLGKTLFTGWLAAELTCTGSGATSSSPRKTRPAPSSGLASRLPGPTSTASSSQRRCATTTSVCSCPATQTSSLASPPNTASASSSSTRGRTTSMSPISTRASSAARSCPSPASPETAVPSYCSSPTPRSARMVTRSRRSRTPGRSARSRGARSS